MNNKVLIIAEAGVNHNGSLDMALKMVDAAVKMGADLIKFQTYIPENLVTRSAPLAEYQQKNQSEESQFEMLRKLALSFPEFEKLSKYANDAGITFISTPFDLESVDFLHTLNMPLWKIPSGEITNYPYLKKIASFKEKIILSTGMSSEKEVEDAVRLIKENGTEDLTLLHCTTEYPAPYDSVNLRAMDTLRAKFGLPVGYSDHTKGNTAAIAAVARGAAVIEKHFTLDNNLPGPDHKASLEPAAFKEMVDGIRLCEELLGDGRKQPSVAELPNRAVARKSIVCQKDIKRGEIFTEDNLTTKRPGDGVCPMEWEHVMGRTASRDYRKDEKIDASELK